MANTKGRLTPRVSRGSSVDAINPRYAREIEGKRWRSEENDLSQSRRLASFQPPTLWAANEISSEESFESRALALCAENPNEYEANIDDKKITSVVYLPAI